VHRREHAAAPDAPRQGAAGADAPAPGAQVRAARKELQRAERELGRLEREIERLAKQETALGEQMAASATDHGRLLELQSELDRSVAERASLETAWLQASETLEA